MSCHSIVNCLDAGTGVPLTAMEKQLLPITVQNSSTPRRTVYRLRVKNHEDLKLLSSSQGCIGWMNQQKVRIVSISSPQETSEASASLNSDVPCVFSSVASLSSSASAGLCQGSLNENPSQSAVSRKPGRILLSKHVSCHAVSSSSNALQANNVSESRAVPSKCDSAQDEIHKSFSLEHSNLKLLSNVACLSSSSDTTVSTTQMQKTSELCGTSPVCVATASLPVAPFTMLRQSAADKITLPVVSASSHYLSAASHCSSACASLAASVSTDAASCTAVSSCVYVSSSSAVLQTFNVTKPCTSTTSSVTPSAASSSCDKNSIPVSAPQRTTYRLCVDNPNDMALLSSILANQKLKVVRVTPGDEVAKLPSVVSGSNGVVIASSSPCENKLPFSAVGASSTTAVAPVCSYVGSVPICTTVLSLVSSMSADTSTSTVACSSLGSSGMTRTDALPSTACNTSGKNFLTLNYSVHHKNIRQSSPFDASILHQVSTALRHANPVRSNGKLPSRHKSTSQPNMKFGSLPPGALYLGTVKMPTVGSQAVNPDGKTMSSTMPAVTCTGPSGINLTPELISSIQKVVTDNQLQNGKLKAATLDSLQYRLFRNGSIFNAKRPRALNDDNFAPCCKRACYGDRVCSLVCDDITNSCPVSDVIVDKRLNGLASGSHCYSQIKMQSNNSDPYNFVVDSQMNGHLTSNRGSSSIYYIGGTSTINSCNFNGLYVRSNILQAKSQILPYGNLYGCGRAKPFRYPQKKRSMFSFLMPEERLKYLATICDKEGANKCQRRPPSQDLSLSVRFHYIRHYANESLGVFRSSIHGLGLYTYRDIEAGEMVIEYAGEVIRSTTADARERRYDAQGIGCYMFRCGDDVVDATMCGNMSRFINHSCEPNCYSRQIVVSGRRHIIIFSSRDIQRGEELTYNYKFPIEDVKMPCMCNARKCRKYLN